MGVGPMFMSPVCMQETLKHSTCFNTTLLFSGMTFASKKHNEFSITVQNT